MKKCLKCTDRVRFPCFLPSVFHAPNHASCARYIEDQPVAVGQFRPCFLSRCSKTGGFNFQCFVSQVFVSRSKRRLCNMFSFSFPIPSAPLQYLKRVAPSHTVRDCFQRAENPLYIYIFWDLDSMRFQSGACLGFHSVNYSAKFIFGLFPMHSRAYSGVIRKSAYNAGKRVLKEKFGHKKRPSKRAIFFVFGAEGETRTPMQLPALDPEPSVSTNSTTSARLFL